MNGLAIASALTVLTVMLTAITLLPALLSLLGTRAFGLRMPWTRNRQPHPEGVVLRQARRAVARRPFVYLAGALIFVLALAASVLHPQRVPRRRRQAGRRRPADRLRPHERRLRRRRQRPVPASWPSSRRKRHQGRRRVTKAIERHRGRRVVPPRRDTPSPGTTAALIQVQPDYRPAGRRDRRLLQRLRNDVVPAATAGTGSTASVGGSTAVISDFGEGPHRRPAAVPLVVVGLGLPRPGPALPLARRAAHRGPDQPAELWRRPRAHRGGLPVGLVRRPARRHGDRTDPPFLPVMLFAILFGLSMDYQVFLVSRMQEEWIRTSDNRRGTPRPRPARAGSSRSRPRSWRACSSVLRVRQRRRRSSCSVSLGRGRPRATRSSCGWSWCRH